MGRDGCLQLPSKCEEKIHIRLYSIESPVMRIPMPEKRQARSCAPNLGSESASPGVYDTSTQSSVGASRIEPRALESRTSICFEPPPLVTLPPAPIQRPLHPFLKGHGMSRALTYSQADGEQQPEDESAYHFRGHPVGLACWSLG